MRRQKGFTLIELLIVVAIIGIIAAIAIPNLLNAINRGKQKRTMGDIRTIATAVEAYSTDFNFYPKVDNGRAINQLTTYLTPTFVRRLPGTDGWKEPIQWLGVVAGDTYTLYSTGKDTAAGGWIGGGTTDFGADIVYSVGQFWQYPEGMQTGT